MMADFQEEAQAYDIRNDKAMSRLQAATNEKGAYRDRAVFMRSACLAGIAGQCPTATPKDAVSCVRKISVSSNTNEMDLSLCGL